jgi:two-component system response regulator FixJ
LAIEPVVHLIDDDDAVRQSLAFLLTTAGLAVRVHESATAFLQILPKAQPGCVVTDVRMADVDGLELQRRLQAAGAKFPVIIMTGHGDVPMAVQAMKAGAIDFIEKPFDDERMISAIRTALALHDKRGYRDAEIAETRVRLQSLSAREREVLDGILLGHPNKVVAHDLGISPRTVEVHRANVMTKMRTTSLSELVRMALVAGLLPSG